MTRVKPLPDAPDHIAYLLDAAMRRLAEGLGELVDRSAFPELRGSHFRLLSLLPAEGARPSDLAEIAQVTRQALGQFISHLAAHGYVAVEADPADRRAMVVSPTRRGLAAAEAAERGIAELERRWAALTGVEDFRRCKAALRALTGERPADA